MAKIALLMPNPVMVQFAQEAVRELQVDAKVFFSDSDHVLGALAEARKEGAQVAVARGNMASILRHETDVPLVEIQISGQELITTIHAAHQMCDHPDDLIALTGFDHMFTEVEPVAQTLGAHVKTYVAHNTGEVEAIVDQALADGAKVIVGGDLALHRAKHHRMKTLYLNSTKPSIVSALNAAKRVLFAVEAAQRQTNEITSLLNSTFDAILKLDKEGTILLANFMAERIFHMPKSQLVGKNLFDLIETPKDSPFTRALLEQRSTYSTVVRIGREEHVASLSVLGAGEHFVGFVVALQGFRHIDDMHNTLQKNHSQPLTIHRATHELDEYNYPSLVMKNLCKDAAIIAQYDLPVMIVGAPGTRRVRLAECIHNASSRAKKPFVHLDLSAMSPDMQVAQMVITQEKNYGQQNAFQIAAEGGTIVLEHYECLCEAAQPLFKHILTKHYILRSDGVPYYRFDGRIICTVNVDRQEKKWWMPSLPFDFSCFELRVPSLSERTDDLPVLLAEYLEEFSVKYKKYIHVSAEIKAQAFMRTWERDEKEFRSFVEKLVLLSDHYEADEKLIQRLVLHPTEETGQNAVAPVVVDSSEEASLIAALKKYHGNRAEIAEAMGISKTTLWRKLKKHNLNNLHF